MALLMLGSVAVAQAPVVPPQDVTPPAAASTLKLKDMWFEIVITLGMCGLALFTVCRSSPRN